MARLVIEAGLDSDYLIFSYICIESGELNMLAVRGTAAESYMRGCVDAALQFLYFHIFTT